MRTAEKVSNDTQSEFGPLHAILVLSSRRGELTRFFLHACLCKLFLLIPTAPQFHMSIIWSGTLHRQPGNALKKNDICKGPGK